MGKLKIKTKIYREKSAIRLSIQMLDEVNKRKHVKSKRTCNPITSGILLRRILHLFSCDYIIKY